MHMVLKLWLFPRTYHTAAAGPALTRLVDQRLVNVWNYTATSNGCLDQGIQFLVPTNGQLQVSRCDALDFEIFAGVTGQLQDFGR